MEYNNESKNQCTLVTAYYDIKSKFKKDIYLNWANTFMKIHAPIILYTEAHIVDYIKSIRGDRPIQINVIPFEEIDTWKMYKENWVEHFKMDPENAYHTPELYAVWAQKAFFVEKAIQANPFNTSYFFWCDIGAFRNPHINPTVLRSFPNPKHLDQDTLLLMAVGDMKDTDKIRKDDGICGEIISNTWNEVRLVGGLWGGGIKACLQWKTEYQKMLERYFNANRFAGKDQQVMLSTYIENPSIAKVVTCTNHAIDQWFFLEYLLSDLNERYQLNSTYSIDNV